MSPIRRLSPVFAFPLASLLSTGVAVGQTCIGPARVAVAPETSSTPIQIATLPGLAGEVPGDVAFLGIDAPLHGSAVVSGGEILYTPGDRFWSLRSDRFPYRYLHTEDPGTVHTGIAHLVADLAAAGSVFDDFENDLTYCGWSVHDPQSALGREADPASGNHWLRVAEGASKPAFLVLTVISNPPGEPSWPGPCIDRPTHGTTDDCFTMRLAGAPTGPAFDGEASILLARFEDEAGEELPPLEIRLLQQDGGPPKIRAESRVGDDVCATSWVGLGAHNATLELDLWRDHGDKAGLMLRVDGRSAGLARCLPAIEGLTEVRVGLAALEASLGPYLRIDDVGVGDRVQAPPPARTIDTFECGGHGAWSFDGAWVPKPTPAAASSGAMGLEIDLGAIAGSSPPYGFLQDPTPPGLRTFNLRFRLDPATAGLAQGDSFVLAGGSDTDALHGGEHLRLRLRAFDGALELRAEEKDDADVVRATAWTPLGAGVQTVELQWRAAGGPEADDGWVRLWLDGDERGELVGLDNDGRRVESFRLGGIWVPASAGGVLYVDDVETWD